VQFDPIIPTLKAPGTKRLKLKCDEPLSNFAFNINLRRCNKALASDETEMDVERAGIEALFAEMAVRRGEAGAYTRPLFSST